MKAVRRKQLRATVSCRTGQDPGMGTGGGVAGAGALFGLSPFRYGLDEPRGAERRGGESITMRLMLSCGTSSSR